VSGELKPRHVEGAWASAGLRDPHRPNADWEGCRYSLHTDVRTLFRSPADGDPPGRFSTRVRPNHSGGRCRVVECRRAHSHVGGSWIPPMGL